MQNMSNLLNQEEETRRIQANKYAHILLIWKFSPELLFSRIALKAIFATFSNSRLRHELPTSVNDRLISTFREEFYCHETSHMRSCAKIKPSRKFPNLQY